VKLELQLLMLGQVLREELEQQLVQGQELREELEQQLVQEQKRKMN
jgi:hypothetical protein